jgi:hypothetical protein
MEIFGVILTVILLSAGLSAGLNAGFPAVKVTIFSFVADTG